MVKFIEDEIWDVLNWEVYPPSEDLPLCIMNRHERARHPEVFGPIYEPYNVLTNQDVLLASSGKYNIAYTMIHGKITKWELRING